LIAASDREHGRRRRRRRRRRGVGGCGRREARSVDKERG